MVLLSKLYYTKSNKVEYGMISERSFAHCGEMYNDTTQVCNKLSLNCKSAFSRF